MTRAITYTYSITREYQAYLTYALFGACLFMALIYSVNLYATISQTVALQKIEFQITFKENSVRGLDVKYISLSSNITPEMAKNYGLRETLVTTYINRNTSLGRIALRVHE